MGSVYIQPDEYADFGLPASTTEAQVAAASGLVDAFLRRPEGLVWTPDAAGWPCYMAGLTPQLTLKLAAPIAPGANVVAQVTGMVTPELVGQVLIVDRADGALVEAVVVTSVNTEDQNSVTLQSVVRNHGVAGKMETGLVVLDERALPGNRAVTMVSRGPVARMLAVQGRYAYGRRSQQQAGIFAQPSLLASVQVFGGPPAWYPVNVANVSVSPVTGEVWIPAGALNANFSDVRLAYLPGFSADSLPVAIKAACAAVVLQVQEFPEMAGNIKTLQAGGTKIEKFADNVLDAQTQASLAQFSARAYF